ncbi:PTS system trehalose-specific EIIBC component [Aquibacillus sediminis]|uniref:PTS system trehalose-specific EIIBC component n=1 Tax=Aquibacillus sediminis TaxID=2574734 RepID=UPI00110844BA|nr:PTS system trehalose-specific EIIBC component [Aquibacillus sediminis]
MSVSKQSVQQIVEAIGGKDNINRVAHCVTRLRFSLQDEDKVNVDELENIDLVKGSFSSNGQFQVVIGQGTVNKAYEVLLDVTGMDGSSKKEVKEESAKKLNPFQRLVKVLGDIFIPILPAIITAGLLLGLNNILVGEGIFFDNQSIIDVYPQWQGFSEIVNLIANTAFTFLPGLVGWSAVTRFGGSPLLGIVMGLMLIHPSLMSANEALQQEVIPQWDLFGFGVNQIGYQGQVLPVLLAAYVLAKIEGFLKNRVHDSIQLLVVAPVTLLLTGFIAFIVIGPLSLAIGTGITDAVMALFGNYGGLAGFIYGGINSLLVVTGMHHTFIALDLQLIAAVGMTYLWPVRVMSNIAQGSSALAMMFVTNNKKLKGTALTSSISAFLGVTEPAMFGVNIRFKFPFISAMIGAAIAGMVVAMNGVEGTIGIGGLPGFLNIFTQFWGVYFLAMGIALIVPFVLTIVYAKYKENKENNSKTSSSNKNSKKQAA